MPGISSVFTIAKEALLAYQMSMQVTSHNVASADTPGFSRQQLTLAPNIPVLTGAGVMGNGVRPETVKRQYDQFMVQRLTRQQASLGNLTAQQETMRVVETVFNEAPGLTLNDLMSRFWQSWQDLANNPELNATRESTRQQAQMIIDHFRSIATEVTRVRGDLAVKIEAGVDRVNTLSAQIAELNVQITSSETPTHKANDLRDVRDERLRELADYLDITHFETGTGAVTVMLTDGHPLVDKNASWTLDFEDDQLQWISGTRIGQKTMTAVGSGQELGGRIGGWLEQNQQLTENEPTNYLGRVNALANAMIREVNRQHSQGVGLVSFASAVTGSETARDTTRLTALLDANEATTTIAAGTMLVNGKELGRISGGVAVQGLAMAKAANTATAVNDALAGVRARLTTLVAGDATTTGLASGETVSFSVNDVAVSYAYTGPLDPEDPAVTAQGVVAAANAAFLAAGLTVEAVLGDGTNGGAINAIVFQNTNQGDESAIVVADADNADPAEAKLGLHNGTYQADASHNTGEITLFANGTFTLQAGIDDTILDQLGMGGGSVGADDFPDDGRLTYTSEQGEVGAALEGLSFRDELDTDNGTFDLWLYNSDGTRALPQPITVSITRAYDLYDVADAINTAVTAANAVSTTGSRWLEARVDNNRLVLTPDSSHQFAFANDSAGVLLATGINTFFAGDSASAIALNDVVATDLTLIAAGMVDAMGDFFAGDNTNALAIAGLQQQEAIAFTGNSPDSFDGFYNTLVSDVGNSTRALDRNTEFSQQVSIQLKELRDSVAGVSMDEEMANLIRYQHAYSAAAKFITAADEMLQTLLASVQ
ncbi:MAG: flagellar hook-associated protein FlgK [Thermodesulfobacteriota bacterium]